MRPHLKIRQALRHLTLTLLALATASTLHAATLFSESWSGLNAGQSAVDSGRWSVTNGSADQLLIVKDPAPGFTGSFLAPVYGLDPENLPTWTVLPSMSTTGAYAFGEEALELSVSFAFTGSDNSYYRFGLQSSSDPYQSYWFQFTKSQIKIEKRTQASGTSIVVLGSTMDSPLVAGQLYTLTMRLTPVSETENELQMFLDGTHLFTVSDSSNLPNLGDDLRILLAMRDPQAGYISNITLATIPESNSTALLLGGVAIVALFYRRRRAAKVILGT